LNELYFKAVPDAPRLMAKSKMPAAADSTEDRKRIGPRNLPPYEPKKTKIDFQEMAESNNILYKPVIQPKHQELIENMETQDLELVATGVTETQKRTKKFWPCEPKNLTIIGPEQMTKSSSNHQKPMRKRHPENLNNTEHEIFIARDITETRKRLETRNFLPCQKPKITDFHNPVEKFQLKELNEKMKVEDLEHKRAEKLYLEMSKSKDKKIDDKTPLSQLYLSYKCLMDQSQTLASLNVNKSLLDDAMDTLETIANELDLTSEYVEHGCTVTDPEPKCYFVFVEIVPRVCGFGQSKQEAARSALKNLQVMTLDHFSLSWATEASIIVDKITPPITDNDFSRP